MPNPINYTGLQTVVNPSQAILQGVQTGAAIQNDQFQQQQQQAALAAQQRQQQDLQALTSNPNPTAQDYANYTLRNPSQADAAKQSFSLLDTQQQKQKIGTATQVYSALQAGRPELADQILAQQEQAQQNGGSQADLHGTQALRQLIQTNPSAATHTAGIYLSSAMGPQNFAKAFVAIGTDQQNQENQPLQQAKGQAEISNINSQIDTRAQDLDIKRADTQIKALTANLARETNDIQRQKLQGQLQDAQVKRDQLAKDQAAGSQSQVSALDNALDTVAKVQGAPGLSNAVGGVYASLPNLPGSEASNAQALIDQLKSQTFLGSVKSMVGLGALSDAEGAKINNAVGNLDTKQSLPQFNKQLDSIRQILQQNRQRVGNQSRAGVPARQDQVIAQHPVYGDITQERINAAAAKAGITPQQLLDRINQGGQ